MSTKNLLLRFDKLSSKDAAMLGGKDAALGGLIRMLKGEGVRVPKVSSLPSPEFVEETSSAEEMREILEPR
jgi:phosphoenolpyruvate synthase/pyruvate phosphate dikinase